MGESRKMVRLIVCLMGLCFVLAFGDTVFQRRAKSIIKTRKIQYGTSPGKFSGKIAGSVAHINDGSLAPLYDFLIHHKLHTFCKLLRDAGIEQDIKGFGASWTLFVPTDDSFIFLPEGTLEELERNPSLLRDFILYHFIVGDFPSAHIQNELVVKSAQGSSLRFNVYGKTKTVSGSVILEPDLLLKSGRVHIVDRPLYPIPVEDILTYLQRNHKEMYKFLVDDDVIRYLSGGTFTILAADDEAFNYLKMELKDKLLRNVTLAQRILLNHILPGSVYVGGITDGMQWKTAGGTYITFTVRRGLTFANGIPIVLPDIPFTNGVMHIVNRVLLPEDIEVDCQCEISSGEIFGLNRVRAHGSESGNLIASGLTGSLSSLYPRDPLYLQRSYSIPTTLEQQTTKSHEVSHLFQPQSGSMSLQTGMQRMSHGSAISGIQSSTQGILQPISGHLSTGLSLGSAVSGAQSGTQTILQPVSGYQSTGLSQGSTVSGKQTSILGIHQPIVGQQSAGLSLRSAAIEAQSATQRILQPISSHVSTGLSLGSAISGTQSAAQGILQPISVYQSTGLPQVSTVSGKQTSTLGIHQPIVGQQSVGLSLRSAASGAQSAAQGILQPISGHLSTGLSLGSAVSGAQSATQGILQPSLGHLSTGLSLGSAVSGAQSATQGIIQPISGHVSTGLLLGSSGSGIQSSAQGMHQAISGQQLNGLSLGSAVSGRQSSTQRILHPISGQQYTHMTHVQSGNLQNIVETSPMLHSLNEAIKSSNIAWILSDVGPMTFFAPSDTAFNSLTEKERKGLIKNKNAFTDLLKRHIVRGMYFSNGIKKDTEMKSENDKAVKLSSNAGIFYVNAVPVTYPDNAATNGVLHVIDRFL